jgi:hypothetical protein
MSKILIVEPHKMLSHAFAVALSPDHEIEVVKAFASPETLTGVDVAIIDAASLRESTGTAPDPSSAESWPMPIIWIDDNPGSAAEKLLCLEPPVDREALKRAVAQCTQAPEKMAPADKPKSRAPSVSKSKSPAQSLPSAAEDEQKFIELVDVVE